MKKLFFFLLIISIIACKADSASKNTSGLEFNENLPEDFLKFHMRFHQDSIFQIEHISFPLSGIPNTAYEWTQDSLANFQWEKEEWRMHKPYNYSEEFERKYVIYSPKLIAELIFEKKSGFGIERRFSKTQTGWQLIYYVGMNEIQ